MQPEGRPFAQQGGYISMDVAFLLRVGQQGEAGAHGLTNGVLAGSAVAERSKGECEHHLCSTNSVGYAAGFTPNGFLSCGLA